MKYIAYCRKSSDEKDRQVLSIEAQVAELKEFANREHLEITDFICESKTAKEPGREKFAEVLRMVESGIVQGILSWHTDRLARNSIDGGKVIYLLDTGKLLDLKFPSFWFENTPQGKFMLSIAFGQSKYYVDNLSENVKRGIRQKLRNGVWPSKAPLGYINNLKIHSIEIDPDRVKAIRKAFELFSTGNKSFTSIAQFLATCGIRRKSDKILHINQVRNILANKFYVGILVHNGEYYDGNHKCFISKKLFAAVQSQLAKIARPRNKGHNFPFVGLARCGECGGAITAEEHTKFYPRTRGNVTYVHYRCSKKFGPCSQRYIPDFEMEKQLRKIVDDVSVPELWEKEWLAWLDRDELIESETAKKQLEYLKIKLEEIERKLNLLLDSYLDQVVSEVEYKQKKNEFFDIKLKLQEEMGKLQKGRAGWLEPMREFVNGALSCAKIARAKNNCHDLAIMAKTVGSNYFLKDRRLGVCLKNPFAELCATRTAQSYPTASTRNSLSAAVRGFGYKIG